VTSPRLTPLLSPGERELVDNTSSMITDEDPCGSFYSTRISVALAHFTFLKKGDGSANTHGRRYASRFEVCSHNLFDTRGDVTHRAAVTWSPLCFTNRSLLTNPFTPNSNPPYKVSDRGGSDKELIGEHFQFKTFRQCSLLHSMIFISNSEAFVK